jgi:hypothetical protein
MELIKEALKNPMKALPRRNATSVPRDYSIMYLVDRGIT